MSGETTLARRVWREQLQPVAGASMLSFEKIAAPQILPHARALPGGLSHRRTPSPARRRHGLAANQAPGQLSADSPRWGARRT